MIGFVRAMACYGALLLGACATLDDMPVPIAGASSACAAGAGGADTDICRVVTEIRTEADAYSTRRQQVSNERATVQRLALGSAIIGSGFVLFDAHNDNVKAAGLATGTASLLNGGLRYNEWSEVLHDAASSANCFVSVGNAFASAYGAARQIEGTGTVGNAGVTYKIPDFLSLTRVQMNEAIGYAQGYVARTRGNVRGATAQANREALTESIRLATEAYAQVQRADRAFNRVHVELANGWGDAKVKIDGRLRGHRPNIEELIAGARRLSTELAEDQAPPAATPAATGGAAGAVNRFPRTDNELAELLNHLTAQANRVDPEHYITAFERIAVCTALAAT